jgi:CheY-like chemotaxis protein
VLLAEDNLINQTVAKKMLTTLGLVCEVACNGQEAVAAAKRGASDGKPFDVILMDMAMPLMGGVEAARVPPPPSAACI